MTDVVIVGGGLAGLVAARHLATSGADVTLFEERETVGGRVRSRHAAGYVLDRGFQVLFTGYPAVGRELDLDALGLRSFTPGATIARPGQRSVLSDPFGDPTSLSRTLFNPEVATGDLLRLLVLRRELRRSDHERLLQAHGRSIADYLAARGFSRSFREAFAAPFYGGITLDRSLSTDATVFASTFRAITTGRAAVPADGMGAIPAQIADRALAAGATVETGTMVTDVGDGSVTVRTPGETVTADAVVVATDPPTARDLTGVERIPARGRGCLTVHCSLPSRSAPDLGRRIVLNAADDRPNHVAPMSAVAPEYAPDGRELFSATFLDGPASERDDDALLGTVRDALGGWYPEARFDDLALVDVDRIPFAQFAQPPGFRDDLPTVDEPAGPVYLAGEYTHWSSIEGAMESGRRVAAAIVEGT